MLLPRLHFWRVYLGTYIYIFFFFPYVGNILAHEGICLLFHVRQRQSQLLKLVACE